MLYNEIVQFWKDKNIQTEAELESALHSYSINFAFNSGKIENENISYHDTREIFDKNGVTNYTGDLRTLYEIQNSKEAYELILKAFDHKQAITEEFIKKIQKALTKGTYDPRRYSLGERPGQYKIGDYVTGRNEVGALAEDVPDEMNELLEEITNLDESIALTAAAYFHAKFENIHPFSDGNGRTGRLLMNYLLLTLNHPPVVIHEEDKKQYFEALEAFDEKLLLDPLKDFLKKQIEKTWGRSKNRNKSQESAYPKIKLANIIKEEKDQY